jgi:hypothetical protein
METKGQIYFTKIILHLSDGFSAVIGSHSYFGGFSLEVQIPLANAILTHPKRDLL